MKAQYNNPIAIVGIVLGVIGVVVLALLTRKTVSGYVPLASDPEGVSKSRTRAAVIAGGGVVALGGLFTSSDLLAVVGLLGVLAILVGGFLMLSADNPQVQVTLSRNKQTVTLKKVHPQFAQATQAALANQAHHIPQMDPTTQIGMGYVPTPGNPAAYAPAVPHQQAPNLPPAGWNSNPAPMPSVPAPTQPVAAPPAAPPADPFAS